MKVIAVIGSPRKNGNTEFLASQSLEALAEEGIETEVVRLSGLDIRPCTACNLCKEGEQCSIKDDMFSVYEKMKAADGIIIGSPVYFGSCSALIRALLERAGYVSRHNGETLKGKVGGPVVVARRAGQNFAFAELELWFYIVGMIVPGSSYWNIGFGRDKGEVSKDEEAITTARNFGKNMAFVMKKLKA